MRFQSVRTALSSTDTPDAPITHVALTVSNLDRSVAWYRDLFGVEPIHIGRFLAGTPHAYQAAIWKIPNLGLHCFDDGIVEPFDPRRPGLDHLALHCDDRDTLLAWKARIDHLGYRRGEVLDETYGSGLVVFDPDGIAIELFTPHRPPQGAPPT